MAASQPTARWKLPDEVQEAREDPAQAERNARLQRLKSCKLAQVRGIWSKEQGVKDIRRHIYRAMISRVSTSPARKLPPHQQER